MQLSDELKVSLRKAADALIAGRIGDKIALTLPADLRLRLTRSTDQVVISWPDSANPEIDIPLAPDPDILSVFLRRDKLGIQFGAGTVWFDL